MVELTGTEPVISYWQSSSTAPILLLLCQLRYHLFASKSTNNAIYAENAYLPDFPVIA